MKEISVNANDSGQRLDKFLTKYMPNLPKSMLYKGLRKNCVRINGRHVKEPSVMLNDGDVLTLYFKDEFFTEKKEFEPVPYDLDIVYEDENLIIINKPPSISVHSEDKTDAVTLIDMVKSYLYDSGAYNPANENSFSPAFSSRLDKNTGGLIPCAKTAAALRALNENIREHRITKEYTCIAEGHFSEKHGVLRDFLTRGDKKVTVGTDGDKEIITEYEVLDETEKHSVLRVTLHTGRTHQIRAHLAYCGHPLAGDKKYGAVIPVKFRYQALYCTGLTFHTKDCPVFGYLDGKKFEMCDDAVSFMKGLL